MQRALLIAAIAFLATPISIQAQVAAIDAELVAGHFSGDTVTRGSEVRWNIHLTNTLGEKVSGSTNGFHVWTHRGGVLTDNFSPITYDTIDAFNWKTKYDLVVGINAFGVDGTGKDTIGFGGASLFGPGIPDGTVNEPAWTIATIPSTDGDTLCLDSVTVYPPGSPWIWSVVDVGIVEPTWNGPHCYHVELIVPPPFWLNCPSDSLVFDHCDMAAYDFDAEELCCPPVTYNLISGPGSIDPGTGVWTYTPSLGDVGTAQISVEACNIAGLCTNPCVVDLIFTNEPPVFVDGCNEMIIAPPAVPATHQVVADPVDCDTLTYFIANVSPTPAGPYGINTNTGEMQFTPHWPMDGYIVFQFDVCATDGNDTVCCPVLFDVVLIEPYEVQIEKTHLSIQGQHEYVDVTLLKGSEELGGFDFLIAYDRSALNFQSIIPGPLFDPCPDGCGWEYVTYRTWFWPSYEPHFFWGGIIRVVAIADMNDGANHPCCYMLPKPWMLFTIDFIVTDNRLYECQFVPVSFFWTDCGDNTMSSRTGDTLYVSRFVYGFDLVGDITDMYTGFPTYTGVQAECLEGGGPDKPVPNRLIDFISGGVDIACADELDDRGDINLNGVPNEIADAVVFTNYFIYGFSAFHVNVNGQIAATDVNADGLTLTVGDLVYLIRVIVGDALPYPKLAPVEATYVNNQGILSVDTEMGAAFVTVRGSANPTLLADGMEMKYAYNEEENLTRVLVYSLEGYGFHGEFLDVNGELVSIELGSYEGAVVKATEVPADYALSQNYPNPFNPSTTISFHLPIRSDYTLTVYNVTGQKVDEFVGNAEAGMVSIEFDASTLASGIYFYKLTAGDYSATKKMIFLK